MKQKRIIHSACITNILLDVYIYEIKLLYVYSLYIFIILLCVHYFSRKHIIKNFGGKKKKNKIKNDYCKKWHKKWKRLTFINFKIWIRASGVVFFCLCVFPCVACSPVPHFSALFTTSNFCRFAANAAWGNLFSTFSCAYVLRSLYLLFF